MAFRTHMALPSLRTCFGVVLKRGVIVDNKARISLVFASHILSQRNASTSRLKSTPKSSSSPTVTRKRPPSSPVHKTKVSVSSGSVSGTQAPTKNVKQDVAGQETAIDSTEAKKYQDMSEEEREKELQRMLQMSELMPTMDLFGQDVSSTLGAFREV